jgi:hypothetical protein
VARLPQAAVRPVLHGDSYRGTRVTGVSLSGHGCGGTAGCRLVACRPVSPRSLLAVVLGDIWPLLRTSPAAGGTGPGGEDGGWMLASAGPSGRPDPLEYERVCWDGWPGPSTPPVPRWPLTCKRAWRRCGNWSAMRSATAGCAACTTRASGRGTGQSAAGLPAAAPVARQEGPESGRAALPYALHFSA